MKKIFSVFLLLTSGICLAEEPTHYITDKVYAPVYAEQNDKSKLLSNGLASGTAITVLEQNNKTGYARIRSADNLEGWVRVQYLSTEAPVNLQLEQANAHIAQLQTEKNQIEEQLVALKQISTSQIDTHARNAELVKQNSLLIADKQLLTTYNERLKDRQNQTWFLYGGLLVALSCIVSVLLSKLFTKRRNDGWY